MATDTKQEKSNENPATIPTILVWLDSSIGASDENTSVQEQLRKLCPDLQTFADDNECEKFLKAQFRNASVILITNGGLGEKLVPRVANFPQINAIYIYCFDIQKHKEWSKNYTKVKDVVNKSDALKEQLETNHFNTKSSTNNSAINHHQSSSTYEPDNGYFICDISMDYISKIKETPKDKDDFVLLCQTIAEKKSGILQQFQEGYTSSQALTYLFNTDPFFYQIINHILQSTDVEKIYQCRFFLRDIKKEFHSQKCSSSIRVYRGQSMPNKDLETLKTSKEKVMVFKSFLSTTPNRDVAMLYATSQNEHKGVLFEIEADPKVENTKPFVKIHSQSDQDNEQIYFMFGSVFKINNISDENGITIIKLTLSSIELPIPFKQVLNDQNQENDLIGFVQLQLNISSYLNSPTILNNLDKLLEKHVNEISNDQTNLIRCYDTLGNVQSVKNDFDSSLDSYKKLLELKKKILPSNDPNLALTYDYIASICIKKNDNTQALEAYQSALMIYKERFGDEHESIVYIYSKMTEIHDSEGRYREVLKYYFKISAIMLKDHPIDDAKLAPIYNNMGKTLVSLCQYPLALGYYELALQIKLKQSSTPPESKALTYKNMGFVYKCMKNIEQARIHFEKAVEIYRQVYSSTHETVTEIDKIITNLSSTSS